MLDGIKERIEGERSKPLRLRLVTIIEIAFAVLSFILVVLLVFYVFRNLHLLQANPCKLCQDLGYTCVNMMGG